MPFISSTALTLREFWIEMSSCGIFLFVRIRKKNGENRAIFPWRESCGIGFVGQVEAALCLSSVWILEKAEQGIRPWMIMLILPVNWLFNIAVTSPWYFLVLLYTISYIVSLGELIRIQLFQYSHQDLVTIFPNLPRYLHKHDAGHENIKMKYKVKCGQKLTSWWPSLALHKPFCCLWWSL